MFVNYRNHIDGIFLRPEHQEDFSNHCDLLHFNLRRGLVEDDII